MFFGATGVGRVCEGLLGELAGQEWVEGIDTVVPAAREKEFRLAFPGTRIRPVFVGYGPMSGADLLLKGRLLGSCAARVKLFFFPGHNVPLSVPGKYVMTVHDLTVFSPLFRLS